MKMTNKAFEEWMVRLDNDKSVTKKERKTILNKMETCATAKEFNLFIKSIEQHPKK